MAVSHIAPTPDDGEEALRPYLGRLYEAAEEASEWVWDIPTCEYVEAIQKALSKALELLGVRE